VVVVLPFDPVMPIVFPLRNGAASFDLPQSHQRRGREPASKPAKSAGTPGDSTNLIPRLIE